MHTGARFPNDDADQETTARIQLKGLHVETFGTGSKDEPNELNSTPLFSIRSRNKIKSIASNKFLAFQIILIRFRNRLANPAIF